MERDLVGELANFIDIIEFVLPMLKERISRTNEAHWLFHVARGIQFLRIYWR
jgi:hypothetical protein